MALNSFTKTESLSVSDEVENIPLFSTLTSTKKGFRIPLLITLLSLFVIVAENSPVLLYLGSIPRMWSRFKL